MSFIPDEGSQCKVTAKSMTNKVPIQKSGSDKTHRGRGGDRRIEPGTADQGSRHAQQNAEEYRQGQGRTGQKSGIGQAIEDHGQNRLLEVVGFAQASPRQFGQPIKIADRYRLVEAVGPGNLGPDGRRTVHVHNRGGTTGRRVDQPEHDHGDQEQSEEADQDSARQIT